MSKADDDANRADHLADTAWAEMDARLKEVEADNIKRHRDSLPPRTLEERKTLNARFMEIQKRCNDKSVAIFERWEAGFPPTN